MKVASHEVLGLAFLKDSVPDGTIEKISPLGPTV
jgi:hypothetical protein